MRWTAALGLPLALLFAVVACGSDDDGDGVGDGGQDGVAADAALGADSSEILPDASDTTRCGDEPNIQDCDRLTQICVETSLGGGPTFECVDLPSGCDTSRDCAACGSVCEAPADTCAETEDDNTLSCQCLSC